MCNSFPDRLSYYTYYSRRSVCHVFYSIFPYWLKLKCHTVQLQAISTTKVWEHRTEKWQSTSDYGQNVRPSDWAVSGIIHVCWSPAVKPEVARIETQWIHKQPGQHEENWNNKRKQLFQTSLASLVTEYTVKLFLTLTCFTIKKHDQHNTNYQCDSWRTWRTCLTHNVDMSLICQWTHAAY